jgi:hypothetical protein
VAWLTDVAGVECGQIEACDQAAQGPRQTCHNSQPKREFSGIVSKLSRNRMAAGNSAEFGAVYPARSAPRGDEPPPLNFRSPLVANCRPNRFVRPMPGVLADRWNLVRLR